jgi:biotin transport system substrate-specific component
LLHTFSPFLFDTFSPIFNFTKKRKKCQYICAECQFFEKNLLVWRKKGQSQLPVNQKSIVNLFFYFWLTICSTSFIMEPVLFLTIHFREEIIMSAVTTTKKKSFTTFQMALIAVMAAITCILGPLSIPIPISPVPISLTNLAIYLTVCLLGWKFGTISYLIYLLIGIAGLPVFSGFSSGFAKLLGPTGGYLIGFIPMAIICGFAFEKFSNRGMQIVVLAIGTIVAYIFGTAWLAIEAHLTFYQALLAGVIPYIPGDLVKIILVVLAGPIVKKRLQSGGFLL